jgi:thioredoxin reductase (NADPH)
MKPVLLTIDDDPPFLRAIVHDLKSQYGNRFDIVQVDSGKKGLQLLKQLKLRNGLVALFLVDQWLPEMTGVEFLEQAKDIYPEAKSVLLTDYADTNAVMRKYSQQSLYRGKQSL